MQVEAYSFAYRRGSENGAKLSDSRTLALAGPEKLKLFPDVVEEFSKTKFAGATLPKQIMKQLQRGYNSGFDHAAEDFTVTA